MTTTRPAATPTVHRTTWWVWAGGTKIIHTANMRGTWGWDASCTCGWESRTGGATRTSVQRDLDSHKIDARLAGEATTGHLDRLWR